MEKRVNRRGYDENFMKGEHLKLTDLKHKAEHIQNKYLFKENIPLYPRPEFHVSSLRHDTDSSGLVGIGSDTGFRPWDGEDGDLGPTDPRARDLVWWSLDVGPCEVASAEKRLLDDTYLDRTGEDKRFLSRFASSPAFQLQSSRLGSYRFTFPLEDLMEAYSQQFCCGSEPILRVYETVLYKQEVMYSVLVDSQDNNLFSDYPLLTDSKDAVVAYEDGHFIWRPEAMCQTHKFQLVRNPYQKQLVAHLISKPKQQFYVWDNVAVAFYTEGQTLNFDMYKLRDHLTFCEPSETTITRLESFDDIKDATELVEAWWPHYHSPFF